jgi:PKD repeat protein
MVFLDGGPSAAVSPATLAQNSRAFDDSAFGGPLGSSTIAHSYAAAGTYIVRLTVTDSVGRSGSATATVTVP